MSCLYGGELSLVIGRRRLAVGFTQFSDGWRVISGIRTLCCLCVLLLGGVWRPRGLGRMKGSLVVFISRIG